MNDTRKNRLLVMLKGLTSSLENGWMDEDAVLNNLLMHLQSFGTIARIGEHVFFREVIHQ